MRFARPRRIIALAVLLALGLLAAFARFSYAPLPDESSLANAPHYDLPGGYDLLGEHITASEAQRLQNTEQGRARLSVANGAVAIDEHKRLLGREAFYRETYGNEVFLTDVMGMIDGGLSVWNVSRALIALHGAGTDNLQVTLAKDVRIGDRVYRKGALVATGLDVPRGGLLPLGIKVQYDRGHIRMGISCALCHATVDPQTHRSIDGAPNRDLNVGLMMALASNSSAYFMHTEMPMGLQTYREHAALAVTTTSGAREPLPDSEALEAAVKTMLASWAPGSFDSTPDLVNNPTSIPSSFAAAAAPYGWSGHAAIGAFRGLSALNNNVHGLNSDTTADYPQAPALFGLDPEVYLGTLLQRAPSKRFRYSAASARRPSEILRAADPTPEAPGLNRYAALPSYPNANYLTSNSLISTSEGQHVGESIDAMSVFQLTLRPPPASAAPATRVAQGKAVFERAGCGSCHGGPAYTDNRILPVALVATEPTRARSFARMESLLRLPPQIFAGDSVLPLAADARLLTVPLDPPGIEQIRLAWAHGGSDGGYKVQSLVGLRWSAPYLHDGGVAVGADAQAQRGLAGTLYVGLQADPANSLKALIDRPLRARVIAANRQSARARTSHVTGEGHPFWADAEAGFSEAEQQQLVAYLLSLDRVQ